MGFIDSAAYEDGTYDKIKSFDDLCAQLNFRNNTRELKHIQWWAAEPVQFRAYLVRRCMKPEAGQMTVPVDRVRAIAHGNWESLSHDLKCSIDIEMQRLLLSAKAVCGA